MADVTRIDAIRNTHINLPLFFITGGFILAFCALALIDLEALSAAVDWGFAWSARLFGLYWQLLLLATFLIGLVLCVLPGAKAKMGGLDKPEFTHFQWGSMIMCTLLAGGGVFWAAGEPMAHFISPPPLFGGEGHDRGRRRAGAGAVLPALGLPRLGDPRLADHGDADALPLREGPAERAADAALPGLRRARAERADRPGRRRRLHHRGRRRHGRPDRLPRPAGLVWPERAVRAPGRLRHAGHRHRRAGRALHRLGGDRASTAASSSSAASTSCWPSSCWPSC